MRKKYLIAIIMTFVISITGCSKSSTNIEKYLNSGSYIDSDARDFMPTIEDLLEYKDISYQYNKKSMALFQSNSISLVVKYDSETYNSEKENLTNKYTFLSEKIDWFNEGFYNIPEYEFSINSYDFKVVLENDKASADYPKSFGMIGTSDEKNSIAYLYFHDFDLDYIDNEDKKNPMADFVNEYFEYKF